MRDPRLSTWTAEPLASDVRNALGRLLREQDVRRIAVMPDVHLAKEVCVGVAVATANTVWPAAVGGDIGCGMAAMAFDAPADRLDNASDAARLLEALYESIPIVRQNRARRVPLPAVLRQQSLSDHALEHTKAREGPLQLGTLGRGNHFIELQADQDGRLWLMVHTGSRGLGQAIRSAHESQGVRGRSGLRYFEAHSDPGRAYLHDMQWALAFAEHNRRRIVEQVADLLRTRFGINPATQAPIECHHNFVRHELHGGDALWVHRKGAISANDGEPGVIPGSMGSQSHHVLGRGDETSLCSSSHGAGRVLSRAAARQRISRERLHDSMQGVWFDHRRAHRLVDEAPDAYKPIGAVMKAQRALTKVIRTLRPLLSFKGA